MTASPGRVKSEVGNSHTNLTISPFIPFIISAGYQRMSDALAQVGKSVGRNFVFSLCEWGWVSFRKFSPFPPWHIIDVFLVDCDRLKSGCKVPVNSYQTRFLRVIYDRRWGAQLGHSWRVSLPSIGRGIFLTVILAQTTGDISTQWESLTAIINLWEAPNIALHVLSIYVIHSNSFLTQATNFYGRNDMDMVSNIFLVSFQASRLI